MDSTSLRLNRSRLNAAHQCRGGFLYVAVLFTTLLVMVAVTAALSISTTSLRGETDRASRDEAIRFVESEIHRQAAIMKTSSAWRSDDLNDSFSAWHSITLNGVNVADDAQVRHRFTDSDGDLADDDFDPVQLTVHAIVGRSQAALTVQLEPDPQPLDLLAHSLTASRDLQIESDGTVVAERPVQVARNCRASASNVLTTPQLECDGAMEMTLRGDLAKDSVTMPTRDVVAKYVSLGTEINFASIPEISGELVIEDCVLSADNNPFGATDANGIYWIDAGGKRIVISNCRLNATLAIVDAIEIVIGGGIVWHYPGDADVILATNVDVRFENVETTLDENTRGVNFNPSSAPYRQSVSNLTTTDVFPTELRGILYSTKEIRFDPLVDGGTLRIVGSVIAQDVRVEGHLAITQLDEVLRKAPPGLSDLTPMRLVRGTFRRIPTP